MLFFRYRHCQSHSPSLCRSTSLEHHLVKYDTPTYHKTTLAEHTACRFYLFCYFMCYRNYVVAHKFQTEIQRRKLKKDTTPRRVQCTEHILKLRTFSITEESLKLIGSPYVYIYKFILFIYIYRVSQEEWTKLRESVPYVELYRYNPKHIYTKLNGYGDNGQRSFRL